MPILFARSLVLPLKPNSAKNWTASSTISCSRSLGVNLFFGFNLVGSAAITTLPVLALLNKAQGLIGLVFSDHTFLGQ